MTNVELVRELLAALDAGDFERVRSLAADDFETVPVMTGEPMGLDDWLASHEELHRSFPDLRRNPSGFAAEGDTVTVTLRVTATHDHHLRLPSIGIEDLPPTGLALSMPPHVDTFTVRDGKVTSVRSAIPSGGGLRGMLERIRDKEGR